MCSVGFQVFPLAELWGRILGERAGGAQLTGRDGAICTVRRLVTVGD